MGKGGDTAKAKPTKAETKAAKQGLLEKNGDLTKQLKAVLREVFDRFDVDRDGALSKAELEAFAVASKTGENLSQDEIKQLGTFFDTNESGDLTHKGFEQMYLMQTASTPEDTWRDIKALGYDKTLELRGTSAPPPPPPSTDGKKDPAEAMSELRTALMELKLKPDEAGAHRRVGVCYEQLGKEDAAKREFAYAEELEKRAAAVAASTVEEID
jgi:hypothetical protein